MSLEKVKMEYNICRPLSKLKIEKKKATLLHLEYLQQVGILTTKFRIFQYFQIILMLVPKNECFFFLNLNSIIRHSFK